MSEFIVRAEESDLFFLFKDFKELTRCRDCKKYVQGMTVTEWYFCSMTGALVDGQDFCSWAERKEK